MARWITCAFCLALLAAISYAGGCVPWAEIIFSLLFGAYLAAIAKLAFAPVTATRPPIAFAGSRVLKRYVACAGIVGVAAPLIFVAISGDALPVPHTALLLLQIAAENVTGSFDSVSFPIRAFVPIGFNARRLFSVWAWLCSELSRSEGRLSSSGAVIAAANMLLWSFNLFCFLIPVFLPVALRFHYKHEQL